MRMPERVLSESRCLNTVLRELKPPIFCSRTCRMDTILGTPKKEGKGLEFAKELALQNIRDLASRYLRFQTNV